MKIQIATNTSHDWHICYILKEYENILPDRLQHDITGLILHEVYYIFRDNRAKKVTLQPSQSIALYAWLIQYDITDLNSREQLNTLRYFTAELEKKLMKYKQVLYSKITV